MADKSSWRHFHSSDYRNKFATRQLFNWHSPEKYPSSSSTCPPTQSAWMGKWRKCTIKNSWKGREKIADGLHSFIDFADPWDFLERQFFLVFFLLITPLADEGATNLINYSPPQTREKVHRTIFSKSGLPPKTHSMSQSHGTRGTSSLISRIIR